jgi:1-phosphofructokinase family hexose kinase
MIYTLTLNPTIDHTLTIGGFAVGGTFKASQSTRFPAGKGINVAHVAATLGEPVAALGLVGEQNAPAFAHSLGESGIQNRLVSVPGGTRISVTILDPGLGSEGQTETHVREPGVAPPPEGLAQVRAQLAQLSAADWVVMAGSLPPDMPAETYRDLIRVCARAGARTCLDASGPPLVAGVDAPPSLLKVNLFELGQVDETALDRKPIEGLAERVHDLATDEIVALARRVQARGAQTVVVTLGERGAIGVAPSGRAWHAQSRLEQPVVDAVGSGDAFGAGLVVALCRSASLSSDAALTRALRLGVACGAANALLAGAGRCRRDDVERLAAGAIVNEIV